MIKMKPVNDVSGVIDRADESEHFMNSRYQRGSLRREKRAGGRDVWVWRYRANGVMKQETFKASDFNTEREMWKHLAPAVDRLNSGSTEPVRQAVTLGTVIDKYEKEHLPELAKSSRDVDTSMLESRIRPRWGEKLLGEIRPMDVDSWIKSLPLATVTKGRAKRLMKQLFDKAMFWELTPLGPNPMQLVKVRGISKRQKPIQTVTIDQVNALIQKLHQPYCDMVLVAAGLGLRISEVLALKWGDIDFEKKTVDIRRSFSHGEVKEKPKTVSSEATLPVSQTLLDALELRKGEPDVWVFPSPVTDRPYTPGIILTKILKPAAASLNIPKLGWHTFRHSYKTWLGATSATLTQQKDLLRHADVSTTGNIYGATPVEEMRPLHEAVAGKLQANSTC